MSPMNISSSPFLLHYTFRHGKGHVICLSIALSISKGRSIFAYIYIYTPSVKIPIRPPNFLSTLFYSILQRRRQWEWGTKGIHLRVRILITNRAGTYEHIHGKGFIFKVTLLSLGISLWGFWGIKEHFFRRKGIYDEYTQTHKWGLPFIRFLF